MRPPLQSLLVPAVAVALSAAAECQEPVDVFRAGERGYASFRIPAVVALPGGALLAFAEGRLHGRADSGDIDIVLKRSGDGGATWGPLQVVADNGPGLFGNPAPVVDAGSGDVVLLVVRQPEGCGEGDIRAGRRGSRTPYVLRSADGGRLWSGPRPLAPGCKPAHWRWYATGPCHAVQLRAGPHAGRIVVPANHSVDGGKADRYLAAHLLLSDDGGRSWRLGAVEESHVGDDDINPSECTAVQLDDGRLYVSTRDQYGRNPATRARAWSEDGGATFGGGFEAEPALVGPVCQAALLHVGGGDRELVLFSGPADPRHRRRLLLRVSDDGCRSWRDGPEIYAGEAAYSDLVALGDGAVGCLFEADGYRRIAFRRLDLTGLSGAEAGRER